MKIRVFCSSVNPCSSTVRPATLPSALATAFFCAAIAASELSQAAVPNVQAGPSLQVVRGHVPAVVQKLAPMSRLSASQNLTLALSLPLRNQEALSRLIKDLADPSSPRYRHYLTPDQFAEMFGPSEADYQAVIQFANSHGLSVTATYPSRLVVAVHGSVADIESALHLTLRNYHHPKETRDFFAPDVEPSLDLNVRVLHVSGLDTYSLPHPANLHARPLDVGAPRQPNAGSGPNGTYLGNDFRDAYLPGVSLAGEGQIVGLLEFDGYFPDDITQYVQKAGLAPVTLENVFVDGFNGTPGSANVEVALDIEVVIAMAPRISKIIVYQAPNPSPWVDIVSRMASDTQVKQFSSSWGGGSPDPGADQVFQQMAAQGQTFFNASGDGDAYTGDIPFPSDSPYLTCVGGTTLTTSTNGGVYVSEEVWNVGGGVGSSGGISTSYPIPSWQQSVDMTAIAGSTTLRNIPDVALTADNIYIVADNGSEQTVGGTSAASPLWAAVTAIANQQTTAGCGASIGFLNPIIYGIGKSSGYADNMHDIIKGDNFSPGSPAKFAAAVGYDLCTGWGSPKPGLLSALAGPSTGALPLNIQPLAGSALISTDLQPVSVTVAGVTNATVFATVSGTSNILNFTNSSSLYTALLQVPVAPAPVSLTVIATAPGRQGVTNSISYATVPSPLNDNFIDATKVPSTGSFYVSNNRYATTERGEPFHNGDKNMAGSLWWAWTATSSGTVLVDTSGSRVDTVLGVYTGSALSTLQQVAAGSGIVAQIHPAVVSFNAIAGQAYFIALASANSNSLGSVSLAVLPGQPADTTPPTVTVTGPQSGLSVTNQFVTVTGTASDLGPNPTGVNKVVLTVNGCSASTASGTTSWTATVPLQPELNIIQAIAFDEAGNASAPATIQLVYFAVSPGNDFFASATPLTDDSGTNSVDSSSASKEVGEPDHAGNAGGKSVWWSFTAPADGVLTLSTLGSTFDTLLAVYTGSSVTALLPVGADDDAFPGAPGGFSYLNQPVHSNVTYHIAVDGYGGASGTAFLIYTFTPTNLVRLTATVGGSGTVQVATINQLGGRNIQPSTIVDLPVGTEAILTPTPSSGNRFDRWSGALDSFVSPLTLVLNSNTLVIAHFVPVIFSDDFESGTLTHLNWAAAGNGPWVLESTNVAAGNWAVTSARIGNNQSSSLVLTTNFAASSGSFEYRVSSELSFDFLKFLIDGSLIHQWSGEAGWATFTFPVPSGVHTLEWRYTKDPSHTDGLDAAFIDNVLLPIVLPFDSSTPAHLAWVQDSTGALLINVTGQTNQQYTVQISTDMIHWQNLSTGPAIDGVVRIDPGTFSVPAQFYRAVVP